MRPAMRDERALRGARREYRESEAADDWVVRMTDREEKHES